LEDAGIEELNRLASWHEMMADRHEMMIENNKQNY